MAGQCASGISHHSPDAEFQHLPPHQPASVAVGLADGAEIGRGKFERVLENHQGLAQGEQGLHDPTAQRIGAGEHDADGIGADAPDQRRGREALGRQPLEQQAVAVGVVDHTRG